MNALITGNFQDTDEAERAVRDLQASGFARDLTTTVVVGASEPDERAPVDNDGPKAGGAALTGAGVGGAAGAAVGVVTAPVLGPAAAVAAVGIGAYVGSLYGTLSRLGGDDIPSSAEADAHPVSHARERASGMWVAVSTPTAEDQDRAISILREGGATDIERPEGTIINGRWTDFDPARPLRPVDAPHANLSARSASVE